MAHANSRTCFVLFLTLLFSLTFEELLAATPNLVPAWRTGIVSDSMGAAHLIAKDVTGDGVADVISCSAGAPFVLSADGSGGYATRWYGPNVDCRRVATGDADGDGRAEIYVLGGSGSWYYGNTITPSIYVFDISSLNAIRSIAIGPSGSSSLPSDLTAGDVDDDGAVEIITTGPAGTVVYDASTLTTEWMAPTYAGSALAIADVDGDHRTDLVVNSNPAYFLDVKNRSLKWAFAGGFGSVFATGDIDGDGKAEVISSVSWSYEVKAFDAASGATKWTYNGWVVDTAAAVDVTGDGIPEVLLGDDQWGEIHVLAGATGTELWKVPNPEHGVSAVTANDVDDDGSTEILWGAGLSSSGSDGLFVADSSTKAIEWTGPDLDGPWHSAVADLNGDGGREIVVGTAQTNSYYDEGTLIVYDGATHAVRWSFRDEFSVDTSIIATGQLDTDPQLEIAQFGERWYNPSIQVYDVAKKEHEWSSGTLTATVTAATIANLGGNIDKIIVGLASKQIEVFNGASPIISWVSPVLDGIPTRVTVAELNGAGKETLIALTSTSIYLFDTSDWSLSRQIQTSSAGGLCVIPASATQPARFIVTGTNAPYPITALNADTGLLVWQCDLTDHAATALEPMRYGGASMLAVASSGKLRTFSLDEADVCASVVEYDRHADEVHEMHFADANGDRLPELVLSSATMVEVDAIPSPADLNRDLVVNGADLFYLINYLLADGPEPPSETGDVNRDGAITIGDIFYLVNFVFAGGAPPP